MEVNPVDPYQFDELIEKMMCETAEERIDHQDHVFSEDFEFELQRKLRAKSRTSRTRQTQRNRITVNSGSAAETVPEQKIHSTAYKPFPKAYAIGSMAACLLLGAVLFRGWQGLRDQVVLNEQNTPEHITESAQVVPEQSSVPQPAVSQTENSFAAPTAEQQPAHADVPQEAILPALPDYAENASTAPAVQEKTVTVVTVLKTVTTAPVTTLAAVTTTAPGPVIYEPGDVDQDGEITLADAILVYSDSVAASCGRTDLVLLSDSAHKSGSINGKNTLTSRDAAVIANVAILRRWYGKTGLTVADYLENEKKYISDALAAGENPASGTAVKQYQSLREELTRLSSAANDSAARIEGMTVLPCTDLTRDEILEKAEDLKKIS